MVIETPDWNKDKFGTTIEGTTNYFRRRDSSKFNPIVGETLAGYNRRLANLIKEQEEINTSAHIYGRKTWFTHRTPSECWICNEINMMWTVSDVLSTVPQAEKLVFIDNKGQISLEFSG